MLVHTFLTLAYLEISVGEKPSEKYLSTISNVLKKQMYMAGLRLAYVIEAIYGSKSQFLQE